LRGLFILAESKPLLFNVHARPRGRVYKEEKEEEYRFGPGAAEGPGRPIAGLPKLKLPKRRKKERVISNQLLTMVL